MNAPDAATLAAARNVLEAMGVTAEQLLAAEAHAPPARADHGPTFADYVVEVLAGVSPNSRRSWRSPLAFLTRGWSVPAEHADAVLARARAEGLTEQTDATALALTGARPASKPGQREDTHRLVYPGLGDRPLAGLGTPELRTGCRWVRLRARLDREQRAAARHADNRPVPDHDGRTAERTAVDALRRVFADAVGDPRVGLSTNPAASIAKPPKGESRRRALTDGELQQSWDETRLGGDDPDLDAMLFDFHLSTGARRGGALALELCDLDRDRALVRLREKGEKTVWQPAPPSLIARLEAFARRRGARAPQDKVLRYRSGQPLTEKRYELWHARIQHAFDWADEIGFSAHVLRHHTGTVIERLASHAVANAFLRHAPESTTGTYVKAGSAEVAAAVAHVSGEPHPLAPATEPASR